MSKVSKKNTPFKNSWKKPFLRAFHWSKKNINHRTVEILAILAALVISYRSLVSSNKSLRISEESLRVAQQNSEESQKETQLLNRPFLQLYTTDNEFYYKDILPTKMKFILRNQGKFPIKILSMSVNTSVAENPPTVDSVLKTKSFPDIEYCFEESHEKIVRLPSNDSEVSSFDKNRNQLIKNILEKRMQVFLYGYLTYQSLLSGDTCRYSFIMATDFEDMSFTHNENTVISKVKVH